MANNTTFELSYNTYNNRSVGENSAIGFILGVIGVVAFTGNVIVIACIRVYRRLQQEVGSLFIVNLCVTDTLTSCIVMSSSFYCVVTGVETVNKTYCQFVCCMNYTLIIVSMLTLNYIAFDRYIAVVHALRYHALMNRKVAKALICWSWLQGLSFGLAPVLEDWIYYDYWEIVCAIQWVGQGPLIYVIIAFSVCFLIPGVALAICYYKVMSVARGENRGNDICLGRLTDLHTRSSMKKLSRGKASSDVDSNKGARQGGSMNTNHNYLIKNSNSSMNSNSKLHLTIPTHTTEENNKVKVVEQYDLLSSSSPGKINRVSSYDQSEPSENKSTRCFDNPKIPITPDLTRSLSLSLPVSSFQSSSQAMTPQTHSHGMSDQESSNKPRSIKGDLDLTPPTITELINRNDSSNKSSSTQPNTKESTDSNQPQRPTRKVRRRAPHSAPHHKLEERETRTQNSYSASAKALRSLFIVVLAFFVCMTPFSATKLYKVILSDTRALPGYVNLVSTLAQYCSSAINPLVYGVLRKDFQTAFWMLVHKITAPLDQEGTSHSWSHG